MTRRSNVIYAGLTRTAPRSLWASSCRVDQNPAEAFHHHGTSGGRPKASSGPRKSLCLMADQAQKIALHTTSALPPTTKTSPRITIAVSYFSGASIPGGARPMNFQRVAVNDVGMPAHIIGEHSAAR
jgi:hypothetical protein